MKKKSKADKKVKVADLNPKNAAAKGGSYHSGGVNVSFADGSVKYLSDTTTTDLKVNKN